MIGGKLIGRLLLANPRVSFSSKDGVELFAVVLSRLIQIEPFQVHVHG